jgi:hypothetical protein
MGHAIQTAMTLWFCGYSSGAATLPTSGANSKVVEIMLAGKKEERECMHGRLRVSLFLLH